MWSSSLSRIFLLEEITIAMFDAHRCFSAILWSLRTAISFELQIFIGKPVTTNVESQQQTSTSNHISRKIWINQENQIMKSKKIKWSTKRNVRSRMADWKLIKICVSDNNISGPVLYNTLHRTSNLANIIFDLDSFLLESKENRQYYMWCEK